MELDDWIKGTEAMEEASSMPLSPPRHTNKRAVSDSNYLGFKLACLCAFFMVASLVVLGGHQHQAHQGGGRGGWVRRKRYELSGSD